MKGVMAASAGNHALALSYHGKDLGIPVTVVMPLNAPIMKISACRKHGADVHVNGADLIEVSTVNSRLLEPCANSNQQQFPDFFHAITVILPSVTRTLDSSNLPLI